jgi:hypothetical protein
MAASPSWIAPGELDGPMTPTKLKCWAAALAVAIACDNERPAACTDADELEADIRQAAAEDAISYADACPLDAVLPDPKRVAWYIGMCEWLDQLQAECAAAEE